MASRCHCFDFTKKRFIMKGRKHTYVDFPLTKLKGLVVDVVQFWPYAKDHHPLIVEECCQPSVGLDVKKQHV